MRTNDPDKLSHKMGTEADLDSWPSRHSVHCELWPDGDSIRSRVDDHDGRVHCGSSEM